LVRRAGAATAAVALAASIVSISRLDHVAIGQDGSINFPNQSSSATPPVVGSIAFAS
jgi:hypothetical protein